MTHTMDRVPRQRGAVIVHICASIQSPHGEDAAGVDRRRHRQISLAKFLEPEADARDSGEVVVLNVAVGDATFCGRVHDAGIGIPLRQEPPVENR
jgi:hypothetical protein